MVVRTRNHDAVVWTFCRHYIGPVMRARTKRLYAVAGASLLVLECIPSTLAADISRKLDIPVIGIGAGAGTDAQVLVMHDLLGLSDHTARFVQNFMQNLLRRFHRQP